VRYPTGPRPHPQAYLRACPADVHLLKQLIPSKVAVRNDRSIIRPRGPAARQWRRVWRGRQALAARLAGLVACLAGLAVCVLAAGCATTQPAPVRVHELAEAQTFPYFPVYWVGPRFGAHPLAAVDGRKSYDSAGTDAVYYGNCLPGKSSALNGNGCVLPLQVTTSLYQRHDDVALGNPHRNALLRGVPAIVYDEGHSIELYSGRLAIDVYADDSADAARAAALLRPINAPGSATAQLPPPVFCPTLNGPQPVSLQHVMWHLPGAACQRAAENERIDRALFGKN